jgi:hypothetical protein
MGAAHRGIQNTRMKIASQSLPNKQTSPRIDHRTGTNSTRAPKLSMLFHTKTTEPYMKITVIEQIISETFLTTLDREPDNMEISR